MLINCLVAYYNNSNKRIIHIQAYLVLTYCILALAAQSAIRVTTYNGYTTHLTSDANAWQLYMSKIFENFSTAGTPFAVGLLGFANYLSIFLTIILVRHLFKISKIMFICVGYKCKSVTKLILSKILVIIVAYYIIKTVIKYSILYSMYSVRIATQFHAVSNVGIFMILKPLQLIIDNPAVSFLIIALIVVYLVSNNMTDAEIAQRKNRMNMINAIDDITNKMG